LRKDLVGLVLVSLVMVSLLTELSAVYAQDCTVYRITVANPGVAPAGSRFTITVSLTASCTQHYDQVRVQVLDATGHVVGENSKFAYSNTVQVQVSVLAPNATGIWWSLKVRVSIPGTTTTGEIGLGFQVLIQPAIITPSVPSNVTVRHRDDRGH
jgi:hypothetical protein